MKLSPDELRQIAHLEFRNAAKLKGETITGVSTDSRTVREGEVFFALRGETFDGHKFLAEAFAGGCAAAVIEPGANIDAVRTMPLLIVADTTKALGELAHHYRWKFGIPVLAVAGSNGKTTTKDMIHRVLGSKYSVLATEGNLNNHIGVPQTLFRLTRRHEMAVVEIGTNHPGEIKYLCGILDPTHGIITNIGREHLEFFRTVGGVAKEEGTLFDTLSKRKGAIGFINLDDKYVVGRARKLRTRVTYGFSTRRASVFGRRLGINQAGCARFGFRAKSAKRETMVQLAVPGEHNATNALSAAAIGLTFKVPAARIKKALENFSSPGKRMEVLNIGGVLVYNDTYNANPDSTMAALTTLSSAGIPGKRIAVLADMKELGPLSAEEHARIGKAVETFSVDYLLTHGEQAELLHDAAGVRFKFHYDQKNLLAEYLCELVSPGDAVLVKGSRSMKMEDVVIFLQERLKARR